MDLFDLRDTVIAALQHLDVDITDDEPETDSNGRVKRTVVIGVTTGTATGRRASGRGDRLTGYVNALVVTPSRDSCLWLTQAVRDVLAEYPLPAPHGPLTDASYDGEPLPEPSTSPGRWSRALAFQTLTKRSRP